LFAITAVCNRSLDKAEAYVQAAGLERDAVFVCSDWREVLARSDVDAVIVALPVYLNLEVATAAAAAGKHALLEKPTAHDLADASALVRLSHERRDEMAIMIGENYPYKNSLRTMARLVMGACRSPRPHEGCRRTYRVLTCCALCVVLCVVSQRALWGQW
jgi:predicted dehydrogenase